MTKIIPIRDLKDTSKISDMCHETDNPIFITKNGYEDMVIMSAQAYDKMTNSRTYTYSISKQEYQESCMVAEHTATFTYGSKIYSINEITNILNPIFKKFKVKSATLFGSYAKGKATAHSDVDILVNSKLKGLKFFGLLNEVSEALTIPVDLIDIQDLQKNSKLAKEIEKTGIKIYG